MNLLVRETGVGVTNLTLPPHNMESTWAGDYPGEFEHLWTDERRKPYLIHWAGPTLDWDRPINELFYSYLTRGERAEWDEQQREKRARQKIAYRASLPLHSRLTHDAKRVAKASLRAMGVDETRLRRKFGGRRGPGEWADG